MSCSERPAATVPVECRAMADTLNKAEAPSADIPSTMPVAEKPADAHSRCNLT